MQEKVGCTGRVVRPRMKYEEFGISVILPVYNGEKYLERTLNNILEVNQDTNMQLILVNDGSNDGSADVCAEYRRRYPSIVTYIEKSTNEGIAQARNTGISNAKKKYVTFMDQDDSLSKGYAAFLEKMEKENIDLCISNYERQIGEHREPHGCLIDEIVTEEERRKDILRFKVGANLLAYKDEKRLVKPDNTVWNCIFRHEFVEKNNLRFYAFIDYEDDYNFLMDAIQASERIMTSEKGWYVYNIANADSESHTGKYISNFKERMDETRRWTDEKMDWIGINEAEQINMLAEYSKALILWGIFNASWRCPFRYKDFSREMQEIAASVDKSLYSYIAPIGKAQKIFLYLFRNKAYKLAGFLNRRIYKGRFH